MSVQSYFFFQAEDGIRDIGVTGVQTCALPIFMYIKNIVNVGRSSGVFLITSLQKPTNDSIPSDIKSQLCTRISLRINDSPASIVDRKSTRLNSSHANISYAVFCLKKKKIIHLCTILLSSLLSQSMFISYTFYT